MATITAALSSKGQVVIPKAIRDELGWGAGTRLVVVAGAAGVMLKAEPKKSGRRFEELIGRFRREGPPLSIEELCAPVDYGAEDAAADGAGQ